MIELDTVIQKRPCSCSAKILHLRSSRGVEFWRCENLIKGPCDAFGLTYEMALEKTAGRAIKRSSDEGWPEPADIRPCIRGGEMLCYLEHGFPWWCSIGR